MNQSLAHSPEHERRIRRLEKVRDFLIAAVICAILAVGIDGICYLIIGETSAGTWYDKYWMGFFFCCAFIVSSFFILRDKLSCEPEYLYLVIVLVVGLFMAWSLSVFIMGWDTGVHFKAVLDFADIDDEFDVSFSEMAYVTTNLPAVAGDFSFDLKGLYHLKESLNSNDSGVFNVITEPSGWNLLNGINYVPCAIVMFFCELTNLSFETKHFLSVVPCVLIYAFVTFFGMRKLRSRKMLYGVIALFPTAMFLAANYGYQYWNTSFFLYGFASLVSFFQRKEVAPLCDIFKMLAAFVLACLAKVAYAPLILLSLIVPKTCFASKRNCYLYRGGIVAVTFAVAMIFLVPVLKSGLGEGDVRGGGQISPSDQLVFILADPIGYIGRLFTFFAPPYYVVDGDIVSGYLSLGGTRGLTTSYAYLSSAPYPLFLVVIALLAFVTFTDKNETDTYGYFPGLVSIVLCFINIVLITSYMYMIFNNVGELAFRGVQSRYLLPFVFPSLAFLGNQKWGLNGSKITSRLYNFVVLALMAFVLMVGWWSSYIVSMY